MARSRRVAAPITLNLVPGLGAPRVLTVSRPGLRQILASNHDLVHDRVGPAEPILKPWSDPLHPTTRPKDSAPKNSVECDSLGALESQPPSNSRSEVTCPLTLDSKEIWSVRPDNSGEPTARYRTFSARTDGRKAILEKTTRHEPSPGGMSSVSIVR